MSNYPQPAVQVVTRFDGRGYHAEFPESSGPLDALTQEVVALKARRKQLEDELRALQAAMQQLQAALKDASDSDVVQDVLRGVGLQDDPVDDIQAAIARVVQRMKEIQEELRAISDEMQALLQELQDREEEHRRALEREVADMSEFGPTAGAEPVRTTVSDAVRPYSTVTVEVNVFPPQPASRARGPVSDAQPHSDVDHQR